MDSALHYLILAMGIMRILLGVAPLFLPGPASRLLGFPDAHDNATSRLMGRLFGVRDVGLGLIVFYALAHPPLVGPMLLFQAAMDGGDLCSIAVPLVRRQGIDRAAILSAVFAAAGGIGWLVMYALVAPAQT